MNILEELKPHINAFISTRDHVLNTMKLPVEVDDVSFGNPPFAIDDGIHYYAVIDGNGDTAPLPFGYQVPDESIDADTADTIYSSPILGKPDGPDVVRYIPLVEGFEIPGERAFCLESVEDSSAWQAVGEIVEQVQELVNEQARYYFNQRFTNALIHLYSGHEELDSVDQSIAALVAVHSVPLALMLRSIGHAVDQLEEEIIDDERGD